MGAVIFDNLKFFNTRNAREIIFTVFIVLSKYLFFNGGSSVNSKGNFNWEGGWAAKGCEEGKEEEYFSILTTSISL